MVLVVAICLQVAEGAPIEDVVSLDSKVSLGEADPDLAGLQEKVKTLESTVEQLKDERSSLGKREAAMSGTNWERNAEDSAARRTRAEAAVNDLERRVQREKENSAERIRATQLRINREVETRKDQMKEHDERMAAKEASMEERIQELDQQSARQDQLLSEQLTRVKTNRDKLDGMGDQMSKLSEVSTESEEVADVLKHKYASGLGVLERKIREQEKRNQDEQLRVPGLKKAIEDVGRQADPLREQSKEERAKAVAAEEKLADEQKRVAAAKSAADDASLRGEHSQMIWTSLLMRLAKLRRSSRTPSQ
jgi:uncharacterized coiled-coil protein SlyX